MKVDDDDDIRREAPHLVSSVRVIIHASSSVIDDGYDDGGCVIR